MDFKYVTIVLCYAIAVAICMYFPRKKQRKTPSTDYGTLMAIVDANVQQEIAFKHQDYRLRDVQIIYDFEDDLRELTNKIMASFSNEFLEDLQYYHPKQYIIRYVTKKVSEYLIQYTKEYKMKTK